jgi:hypothetical protein
MVVTSVDDSAANLAESSVAGWAVPLVYHKAAWSVVNSVVCSAVMSASHKAASWAGNLGAYSVATMAASRAAYSAATSVDVSAVLLDD